jgi:2-C-methyl-D-erythritol 4-phosphate cytidylyltransferase
VIVDELDEPAVSALAARNRSVDPGRFGWGIVLAGGNGARFGGPKQFSMAGGRRLVDLAVEATMSACEQVVLVLPSDRPWDGPPVDRVVAGGADRGSSVRAALAAIPADDGLVFVHQAANPLASFETFCALSEAMDDGVAAAVPGLRPADLVRYRDGDELGAVVGRDELVMVQTPAVFRLEVLRAAHATGGDALEDTSLVTALGYDVRIVPGDPRNVHVATAADLEVVEALLRCAAPLDTGGPQESDIKESV